MVNSACTPLKLSGNSSTLLTLNHHLLFTIHHSPSYFTLTVTSCLPQGVEKVTLKEPALLLTEEMVKRIASPSVGACGSARMMMSAQFSVEGLMRGAPLPV